MHRQASGTARAQARVGQGDEDQSLLLQSSARAGRADVLLNLCERNHPHGSIGLTTRHTRPAFDLLRRRCAGLVNSAAISEPSD
jgi:hypothetical protein